MIVGLYMPGDSTIHNVSAALKLIVMFAIGTVLVFLDGLVPLAILVIGIGFVFTSVAGLGAGRLWSATRPLLIWLAIIAATQIWIADGEAAIGVIFRLVALVWTAALVTFSTRLTDMADVIARLCLPLRPLGVSPDRVAFLIALTIRLIPAVFETVREVRDVQRARGLERAYLAAFVPVLTRVLGQADVLSDALVARGFDRWDTQ
ncbi:MAG: energy-coupling factor transporter transmembrane protein EcfT [Rhodospirillaceae bacterium]|jgi:biotin transport system permease protein|nr:energy-coupling factor transporter transmembrane protein EcfT [Rhodospirillaceae bacterium]MBT5564308.1 energy-coupling factor transporter transmembrane protein EcfT [Rhodospirillaceae bacterium]MBT6088870.1 energy-coupling factor transporter transmembrane protein EcfT [Rhodospirillaceae bacterium]MBT6962303.1 energy-coupling factor transporter transmembrane protein EcfT [Rhodospirillaceae bacterium]MBT7451780.1 energy-coupling factor transporter transmembrane protein EcfT [Rhodospirillaceae